MVKELTARDKEALDEYLEYFGKKYPKLLKSTVVGMAKDKWMEWHNIGGGWYDYEMAAVVDSYYRRRLA